MSRRGKAIVKRVTLDPKPQPPDETDVYSKPVSQTGRLEEWRLTPKGEN